MTNAQDTPPTRRSCRVESHQRCVRNSQQVVDSFDESEQICQQRVELRRVGGVNAPVGSRRELAANCVHTADADATQLDSCVASASAVCIGHKRLLRLIPTGASIPIYQSSTSLMAGVKAGRVHLCRVADKTV